MPYGPMAFTFTLKINSGTSVLEVVFYRNVMKSKKCKLNSKIGISNYCGYPLNLALDSPLCALWQLSLKMAFGLNVQSSWGCSNVKMLLL
jgi:hypothetical protein